MLKFFCKQAGNVVPGSRSTQCRRELTRLTDCGRHEAWRAGPAWGHVPGLLGGRAARACQHRHACTAQAQLALPVWRVPSGHVKAQHISF